MQINYTIHGPYGVAVIRAPKIFGTRLGHLSKKTKNNSSWAIRDFIGGFILRCKDRKPRISLTDIEAVVQKQYKIDVGNVKKKRKWVGALESRSKSIFGKRYDARARPDTKWGRWRPLP